jgi:hypothetical protein
MKYYYPDNLESPATFLLWSLTNFFIIAFLSVFALLLAGFLGFLTPLVGVALYAIMTIQFDDITISDYFIKIGSYLLTKQQRYYWEVSKNK